MKLLGYIDGASRGNPGESGIGVILKDRDGNTILCHCENVGTATNNVAEYLALLACVEKSAGIDCKELMVYSDSELLVNQMNRRYKVRDKMLQKYFIRVFNAIQKSRIKFGIKHIPRSLNAEADKLANEGIARGK
jgi:ribonuclease HI